MRNSSIVLSVVNSQDENMAYAYRNWLETIEDVVLLAPNADDDQITEAIRLLERARKLGCETVKVSPTLVSLGRCEKSDAVSAIVRAIVDREGSTVWQACCGILRWAELTRAEMKPVIPSVLLTTLGTLIAERRHERLSLFLDTANDVIEILGPSKTTMLIDQVLGSLDLLATETSYDSQITNLSVGQKIHLRIVCAKLAVSLRNLGLSTDQVQRWLDIAKADVFSEVRNSVPMETVTGAS